jgi:hypothetical protein
MRKIEREKLIEIVNLMTKYRRQYHENVETLQELNDPNKKHTLYYHKGYRDCYDGILFKLRSENLIP